VDIQVEVDRRGGATVIPDSHFISWYTTQIIFFSFLSVFSSCLFVRLGQPLHRVPARGFENTHKWCAVLGWPGTLAEAPGTKAPPQWTIQSSHFVYFVLFILATTPR